MIYYVDSQGKHRGNGTKGNPFQTINEAARIALPGDEVVVAPGIYREWVNPIHAGTEEKPITYRSEKILGAVITGAEEVKHWIRYKKDIWMAKVPNGIFGGYNPYTTVIAGDWYRSKKDYHTGEVYLNGKSMYEAVSMDEILNPETDYGSWDPEFTVYKWYAAQSDETTLIYANFQGLDPNKENVEINVRRNCFYPDRTGINYIKVKGFVIKQAATTWAPPTAYQEGMIGPHWSKGWIIEDCEISHSKCSGISLGKYLQPENENKWSTKLLKDGTQTERDAICRAQREGWTKENIGSHIVRRCNIHDCGQTGIVGHLGGVFSVIEDNHIHHINNKQNLAGAEIGGIKMHAAIDVIIRRNHFHHCTRGLWLDWQAQGTRVTQNLFHDNVPPKGTKIADSLALAEDIFIEVSHGPTLIDNNILLSNCACRISTQGIAFVHNLIAGSFTWVGTGTDNGGVSFATPRYTPYHVPHRTEIAGFMTILHGDARFYNNIFVQQEIRQDLVAYAKKENMGKECQFYCGTKPYDGYPDAETYFAQFTPEVAIDRAGKGRDVFYDHLPVYTGGNVYFNGAKPCDVEKNYRVDHEYTIHLELVKEKEGYFLRSNLKEALEKFEVPFMNSEMLGEAFEPEQKFESPDGEIIYFDRDYLGERRKMNTIPGPFACWEDTEKVL